MWFDVNPLNEQEQEAHHPVEMACACFREEILGKMREFNLTSRMLLATTM